MYILVSIILIILILLGISSIYNVFKTKISFFINGLDTGFSTGDLKLLWDVSQVCALDQPLSLFWSLGSLNKCMVQLSTIIDTKGPTNAPTTQKLLSKLFDYRTKLQNEVDNKKGITTTKSLDIGQKIRILLPGRGVFVSEIIGNATQLIITVPRQKDIIPIPTEAWIGKVASVYLWRNGDARYVFDSKVTKGGLHIGKPCLFLNHSNDLVRTQKRKAIRAKCQIYGKLFIITKPVVNYLSIENQGGYKCLIENISEAGAQIRIGGKGTENVQIQLQFNIYNSLIVMHGVIRTVAYSDVENQSLLHFECLHIEQGMRNEVLRFVYKILPAKDKEEFEALSQADQDINEADRNIIESANNNAQEKLSIASVKNSKQTNENAKPEFKNIQVSEIENDIRNSHLEVNDDE